MVSIDNRKARYDYEIADKFEAGVELVGSEVKSIRLGHVNLGDSFCFVENGEIFLKNCFIASYEKGSYYNKEERRSRKLLLHKYEIRRLIGKSREKGLTIVPLKMYFKGQRVKVEIALAKGKKQYEKKHTIKERDLVRDMNRQIADTKRK